MKVLFIYGAPAVGKLTVANEIAKITSFKVFHNHLSVDCIQPIFEFGTKPFHKLIELIRNETIAEAVKNKINIIFTFCYAKDFDDEYVKKTVEIVKSNGGEILFVLLTCSKNVLEKRVLTESRQKFGKIKTLSLLEEVLNKYELFSPVNNFESLQIDNTNLSAEITAQKIVEHFTLETNSK